MEIILNQVLILAILTGIGAFAYRVLILTDAGQQAIAKLVVNITLPLLIISSISKIDLSIEILSNSLIVLVFSYCSLALLYIVGRFSARLQHLPKYNASVHTICTMFGNIVFIGYPLFNALYPGGEGVLYAAIYHLVSDTLLWTYGVYTLSNKNVVAYEKRISVKNLINPNFVAFLLSIILVSAGLKLPAVLDRALSGLGGTTLYLAMLFVGAMLAKSKLWKRKLSTESLILTGNKMLLIPLVLLAIVNLSENLFRITISQPIKTVLVVQTAMPCMAIIAVLVKEDGVEQVTSHIFVNTLFCLISLPVIFYLISFFA